MSPVSSYLHQQEEDQFTVCRTIFMESSNYIIEHQSGEREPPTTEEWEGSDGTAPCLDWMIKDPGDVKMTNFAVVAKVALIAAVSEEECGKVRFETKAFS